MTTAALCLITSHGLDHIDYSQIRDAILNEYEVDEVRCEKDLFALLEEMRSEGLIEVRDRAAG